MSVNRKRVFERDGYQCCNCGVETDADELHAHHIVPRMVGGTDRLSNLATLCETCHRNVHSSRKRSHVDRVNGGIQNAQENGKWLGQVPAGFQRDGDGYLQPNLNADHDSGEVGYLELRSALEQIDNGASYRATADGLPVTRQTLSKIDNDEDRRQWYLDADADDELVAEALEPVRTDES